MSYDLAVFDMSVAPRERDAFLAWYDEQTRWAEGHQYDDPAVSSPELRSWFMSMIKAFPAMNGPFASTKVDGPLLTDYSVGRSMIYVAFAWSVAETAYHKVIDRAYRHRVGFYDVSGDAGEVWMMDEAGRNYGCIHSGGVK